MSYSVTALSHINELREECDCLASCQPFHPDSRAQLCLLISQRFSMELIERSLFLCELITYYRSSSNILYAWKMDLAWTVLLLNPCETDDYYIIISRRKTRNSKSTNKGWLAEVKKIIQCVYIKRVVICYDRWINHLKNMYHIKTIWNTEKNIK